MNMSRLAPYLGIVIGLICGIFIFTLFGHTTVVHAPVTIPTAVISAQIQTASSTIKKIEPSSIPLKAIPVSIATALSSLENAALDASASTLRNALVNILCYAPTRSGLRSISASGVIIDPKGIILTNAHVAQYFLLADHGVSCVIRSGSPATNRYGAKLIYISPRWLRTNQTVLTETSPNGNGEYDFAFLAVSGSATTDSLPFLFPSLPLAMTSPDTKVPVIITSYGAQFLELNHIVSELFPTIVFGSVKDVFTFGTNTIDVLALGGSAAAQEGSSGGGVADKNGELLGIITTSTISGATDTRSLSAITASYIRSEYASETGQSLNLLLAKTPSVSINDFAPRVSELESIITAHL
ncbi:MAG: serine protease [Candidatus Kaiserbacteria bacterium]|nr:serine protease [Candidatus Kaiserbacteria bacterium]